MKTTEIDEGLIRALKRERLTKTKADKELGRAVKADNLTKVKEALQKGADADLWPPLLPIAIRKRNLPIVQLLITRGARHAGLLWAARLNRFQILHYILNASKTW